MDKENSHVNQLNNLSVIPSPTKGKEKIGCSIGKENWVNQPANSNVNHLNNLRIAPSSTKGKQKISSSTGKENWFTQSAPASNFASSKIKAQSARRERNHNDSSMCSRRKMAQRARRERECFENYTQPLPKDFPVLTPPKSLSQFSSHAPLANMVTAVPSHSQPSLRTILAEHSPTQLCNVENECVLVQETRIISNHTAPLTSKVCHTPTNCRTNGKKNLSTSLILVGCMVLCSLCWQFWGPLRAA